MASILGGLTFGPERKLNDRPRYQSLGGPLEKLTDWPATFQAWSFTFGSIRPIIIFDQLL